MIHFLVVFFIVWSLNEVLVVTPAIDFLIASVIRPF